jgi:hypothetical protein
MYAVDLRMRLAKHLVVPFADDAVVVHQHGAYHGIGRHAALAQLCQLNATVHVWFVGREQENAKFKMQNVKIERFLHFAFFILHYFAL